MRTQQELRAEFIEDMQTYWNDQKMVDHCNKSAAYIVELEDGNYCTIDKPTIETRFCYGFGYCGVSTEEEDKQARDMAHHAATSQEYFIRKNLEGLDRQIEQINDKTLYGYTYIGYNKMNEDSHYRSYSMVDLHDTPEYAPYRWNNLRNLNVLTDKEREAIAAGLEEVRAAFVKRLNTYLKRYGMSKVHTWTYLVD